VVGKEHSVKRTSKAEQYNDPMVPFVHIVALKSSNDFEVRSSCA
jgi:hypothetical protein